MAYVESFENDGFISYIPVDDLPDRPDVAAERGRGDRFASRLQVALRKRMGEEVSVWRTDELRFQFCGVVDSTGQFEPSQILHLLPTLPESTR